MGLIADLFLSALVLTAGFLVTTRLIPFVVVRALRALGFKAKASPVTAKRIARFKRIKRGYFSFLAITTLFVTSLFLELLVNGSALAIHYDDHTAFPAVAEWFDKVVPFVTISSYNKKSDFGQIGESGVDYRAFDRHAEDPATLRAELDAERAAIDRDRADLLANAPGPDAKRYQQRRHERNLKKLDKREAELATLEESYKVFERGGAWCIMPLYPYGPTDLRLDLPSAPPHKPFKNGLPLGTDTSGRDVLALMLYGFRISLAFALLVSAAGYSIGIVVGAVQGYYGGWTDIITQRFQEIWGSIPFLFTIMIVASIIQPSFGLLASLMIVLTSWLGITYFIRGEFYREKSKDYVQAAIGSGVSDAKVMLGHILPNALVPVVTFAPFAIVGYISSLVSLDFLGFGLPPGTPSWGALLRQGLERLKFDPHLTIIPTLALAATLYAVVMIGEAVREAFDPKVFSRLR